MPPTRSPMKEIVQNWLDNPLLSHVQASCLRLADGQCQAQIMAPEINNEDFDQVIKSIASIVPLLIKQKLLPGQMTWNFTGGKLHYVVRADGVALALFCKPCAESNSSAVNDLVSDFMQQS
jgi:hypothetical protein